MISWAHVVTYCNITIQVHCRLCRRCFDSICEPAIEMVPTFVTAHLEILGFPTGGAY